MSLSSIEQFSEDPRKHIELVRGVILESPRVGARHFLAARRLAETLERSGLVSFLKEGGRSRECVVRVLPDAEGI
jgi:hypothetical protein